MSLASNDVTLEMDHLRDRIAKLAKTLLPVLLVGETGSGKELLAETIHRKSSRASAAFVKANCVLLTETFLESELFPAAHGGTLFLDQIDALALRAQAKLVHLLEVGETVRKERVDVRIVASTHGDLAKLVEEGKLREDLYYLLKGATLRVPPLRERRSEILPLANAFLLVSARRLGRRPPRLSERAADALREQVWPGNVRELRATMECALAMCDGDVLEVEHLDLGEEAPRTIPPATQRSRRGPWLRSRMVERTQSEEGTLAATSSMS